MSWLSNLTGSKPPPPPKDTDGKTKEKLEDAKATLAQAKEEKTQHGFDPTGYERAAKAIREIDKSR